MSEEQIIGSRIVIVGAGGNIGSQLTPFLARCGYVKELILVDPDTYEEKNLRGQNIIPKDVGRAKATVQAAKVSAIAPNLSVTALVARVEDVPMGLLRGDVMLTALDSKLARVKANRIAARLGMPLIDAGINRDAILGRISVCHPSRGTACLECGYTAPQYAEMERRMPCMDDHPNAVATDAPAELGGSVGARQAIECRSILERMRDGGNVESAYEIRMDLRNNQTRVSTLPANPDCRCAHRKWPMTRIKCTPQSSTVNTFIKRMRGSVSSTALSIGMQGKMLVWGLTCSECGRRRSVMRFDHRIPERMWWCRKCGSEQPGRMVIGDGDAVGGIDLVQDVKLLQRTLGSFGFKPHDIITVRSPRRTIHCELLPPRTNLRGGNNHDS